MISEITPLLVVIVAVGLLLALIMWLKLNTFVSLIITAMITGVMLGMPLNKIISTVESGMGSTLGHIALIFGLGAMLGKLLADGGGATRIAHTLIDKFGQKRIQWAVVVASFIIGIALFFEVGLVLLIPIVFTIAKESKVSTLYLGIPMTAALSVTHGFLPPHPVPVMIAKEFGAEICEVLVFCLIVAIPVTIIAGPLFTMFAKKVVPEGFTKSGDLNSLGKQKTFKIEETPGFGISALTALLPVFIMLISTIVALLTGSPENPQGVLAFISFIGEAATAMLISVLFAIFTMGLKRGKKITEVMDTLTNAIYPIGMMLLIIGGGGAFKQVLI